MPKIEAMTVTKFLHLKHFASPEDYALYNKYKDAVTAPLNALPDGVIKIIVTTSFWTRKRTYHYVTIR